MEYGNLTNPSYSPPAASEDAAMKVFSSMVHSYLDLVQRNAFPPAFLEQLIKTFQFGAIDYKEVLMYEVGYLVALAIGVLFIIVMTLVGLFFACCRCCGNCGGKMYQKQTKNMNCKRRFEYLFLLIITLVILAGDICAFYSNSKINKDVKNSFTSFNNTANNLKTYVNSVPKDIDIIINSSSVPINLANSSITGIGPVLGGMIKRSIEQRANITLNTIQTTMDDLNSTAIALRAVNDSFNTLLATQQQLVQNLTTIRNQINQTLSSCSTCSPAPSVSDLTMDANFNNFPDFTNQLKTIDDFLNSGVGDSIQKARQTLNDIPQTVSNQTKTSVQQVQNQLMNIKQKIQDARNSFSVVDELDKVNSYLDMGTGNATLYEPDLVRYEYYRWIVGICLSCIILLIVVCNLFGLLLGPCGHKAHADPTERNCASNSAGDFLMAGAGFSFIFAWLLMLVTGVMFAVGGNFYTSLCKPWSNQQLYQLVDKNINISQKLNLGLSNLNLTTVYGDCAKDYSLWKTLNLSSMYDLDNYLNISQYTGEVNSTLENTNINISSITFLSAAQKDKVTNVATSGIDTFDFTDFNQQVSKNITKTSLTSFANQLDSLAAKSNSSKQTELRDEATALRNIQNSIDSLLVPQINNLSTSIAKVEEKGKALPGSLNATLASINQAQNFVNTQVAGIVKSETLQYLNTIVGYFESYITWTKTMLTQNLARCGPIASALDSAQVIACQYLVDTWNAFWFSLGWCTIFFIPSIILAVKLAKHYRRMKTSDVYENHNDHLEMTTTTSQQFLIPRVTMKS